MSRFLYNFISNISVKNRSFGRKESQSSSAFNRDPKATRAKRVGYQISNSAGGGSDDFEEADVDLEVIANAIRRDSYLMQGTLKYEELIFKSGWSLRTKNEQALEYIKLRLDMMALATGVATEDLLHGIAKDIVWSSNCFLVKARAKGGIGLPPGINLQPIPPAKEPIVGYFRLPPQTVQIARDENGEVTKYKQESPGSGDDLEFNPEDIIHIKVNTPSGASFGDPWLAPVLEDVRLLRKIEENVALLLYKHIFPTMKYKVGTDKPGSQSTDEEIDEVRADLEGMEVDSIIVLPERHDLEAVTVDAIDGKPYLDYFENRVFSGIGLSQVDFGRGDTANRNTADAMTDHKADRVKGWQKAIQVQLDKNMIDELLAEGGFDPLINPDFDVDFVFNEIELERKIKEENHEIFKFNNNIQTWEETRMKMGEDPSADESRLHYMMIGKSKGSDDTSDELDNKNQPENQHGKRSGPKSSTESILTEELNRKEDNSEYITELKNSTEKLTSELNLMYNYIKNDMLERVGRSTQSFGTRINRLEIDRMISRLQSESYTYFLKGMQEASLKLDREITFEEQTPLNMITQETEECYERFKVQIEDAIKRRIDKQNEGSNVSSSVQAVFESMKFKNKSIVKSTLARSYNYGFAYALLLSGETKAAVHYEGECTSCILKNKSPILLDEFQSLDKRMLFYKVPPWHTNCECEVVLYEGGEV